MSNHEIVRVPVCEKAGAAISRLNETIRKEIAREGLDYEFSCRLANTYSIDLPDEEKGVIHEVTFRPTKAERFLLSAIRNDVDSGVDTIIQQSASGEEIVYFVLVPEDEPKQQTILSPGNRNTSPSLNEIYWVRCGGPGRGRGILDASRHAIDLREDIRAGKRSIRRWRRPHECGLPGFAPELKLDKLRPGPEEKVSGKIRERIAELRQEARTEGSPLNEDSLGELDRFVEEKRISRLPSIFLVDNGNFRAVWKGEDNGHLGLQFLGNGEIQYVMFIQRPNASEVSRGAGRDNFEGIDRQILAYVLDDLLYQ